MLPVECRNPEGKLAAASLQLFPRELCSDSHSVCIERTSVNGSRPPWIGLDRLQDSDGNVMEKDNGLGCYKGRDFCLLLAHGDANTRHWNFVAVMAPAANFLD